MSWDGTGRRPKRDKMAENNDLRKLTVGLMKLREDALVERLDIEPTLKEAILEGRSITEFRGKRRKERNIVNILRDADVEDVNVLWGIVGNQEQAEEALLQMVEETFQDLISGDADALQDFLNDNPEQNAQQIRQLVRNAIKAKDTAKTAPRDKLVTLIRETIFGIEE